MKKGILLLTIATFATCGLQAKDNGNQTSNSNSTADQSSASAGPKEAAARLGLDMLDHTNKARTAIANKNKQAALNDIDAATSDLTKAQSDAQGKIIPLYQEFASVSVVAPVRAEQQKNAANSNSSATSNKPVPETVHQVAGGYSVMEIDTDGAMSHLNAAKTALNNENWNAADKDLAALQDGVVFASYRSDMPLVRAQENLILARRNAREDNYRETRAALASSAKALAAYAQESGPHANDAKNLQQEIQSYDQHIMKTHSDAVSKIDGWWNTASNWLQNPKTNG